MAFQYRPDHHELKALQAAGSRRFERHAGHTRALRDEEGPVPAPRSGLGGRLMAVLPIVIDGLRAVAREGRQPSGAVRGRLLTDAACRLADGSLGRVVLVRTSEDGWAEECIPV